MELLECYQRAAELYRKCNKKAVLNERPEIHYIKGSDDFWYHADR